MPDFANYPDPALIKPAFVQGGLLPASPLSTTIVKGGPLLGCHHAAAEKAAPAINPAIWVFR
jgi:hypothetical protein